MSWLGTTSLPFPVTLLVLTLWCLLAVYSFCRWGTVPSEDLPDLRTTLIALFFSLPLAFTLHPLFKDASNPFTGALFFLFWFPATVLTCLTPLYGFFNLFSIAADLGSKHRELDGRDQ